MPSLYVHAHVELVRRLHAELYEQGACVHGTRAWIDSQAETMVRAHATADPASVVQLRSVIGEFARRSVEDLLATPLSLETAKLSVAVDHGFDDSAAVVDRAADPQFEAALDLIEATAIDGFRELLNDSPHLARATSHFGHRATLLHYLAANGVELRRQVVPSNAPRFAMVLIEAGADPTASIEVYRGRWTVRQMLDSSAHPRAAGVADDFRHVLDVAES